MIINRIGAEFEYDGTTYVNRRSHRGNAGKRV